MDLKKLVGVENAFHLAGIAATAFSAKAATVYLQTLSNNDPVTTFGFAGIIGVTVFSCWTFAFLLKPKQRDKEGGFHPLVITAVLSAAMLSTMVSGYTVYQSSMIPLQTAAVEAAKAQDAPLQAKFDADKAAYDAQFANLQTSITDLRNQKTQIEAERFAIASGDKSRTWKQNQAQKRLDELQASIDDKTTAQSKLTAPVFVATKPEPISDEQHRANLARAFFYELSGVLMMFFAYLSRRLRRTAQQAAANPLIEAIAELDAARARANQALEELYVGFDTISHQATQLEKHILHVATEAETNLQKTIRSTEKLFTHANELFAPANRTANDAANRTANADTVTDDAPPSENVLYLLQQELIEPTEEGNLTPKILMERFGFGRPTAEKILKEAAQKGYLESISAGRGITYRYPSGQPVLAAVNGSIQSQPQQGNIFLLTPRSI